MLQVDDVEARGDDFLAALDELGARDAIAARAAALAMIGVLAEALGMGVQIDAQ